ncbi:hypothetical protein NE237_015508 [Protea cynaroides]|uniref:Disease resistance N-terminal domain-containing protein n=1 Tax=Protea cynaroides TaxID=273540 RepID=A0A9Q0KE51_9MAGN|nr:hypothetical protein NE237_015508 [Protea cynaroides]
MAASVVSFFLGKLSALITEEAKLILEDTFILKDAVDRKFIDYDRPKMWVNQVRSITYEAEDVIDEFIYKVEHQCLRGIGGGGIISSFLCTSNGSISQLKLCHNLGNQIETIKRKIEEISANIRKAPLVEEVDVVGMEDEREMLLRQLIQGDTRPSFHPINFYNSNDVSRHFEFCVWIIVSQEYKIRDLVESLLRQFAAFNHQMISDQELQTELSWGT